MEQKRKIILLFNVVANICIFFMVGCSSQVKVTPRSCFSKAIWQEYDFKSSSQELLNIASKQRVSTYKGQWGNNDILIKNLLKKEALSCNRLKSFSIKVSSNWIDVLRAMIPFMGTTSVEFRASYLK